MRTVDDHSERALAGSGDSLRDALARAIEQVETREGPHTPLARIHERDAAMEEVRWLHDALLRLEVQDAEGRFADLRKQTMTALEEALDRLSDIVEGASGGTAEGARPGGGGMVVAQKVSGHTVVGGRGRPWTPSTEPVARTPAGAVRGERFDDLVRPIYDDIALLEEQHGLFETPELRDRVDLLLACMRRIQDGVASRSMTEDQRQFMTTRFGLLESLQKRRNLGYLHVLNRRFHTDWDLYIERLERKLRPLAERVIELRSLLVSDADRLQASEDLDARRKLESTEIIQEIAQLFEGDALATPEGREAFRARVSECLYCASSDLEPLIEVVVPRMDLLEGREFKALHTAMREGRAGRQERKQEPRSVAEAAREKSLEGAREGQSALILGGRHRTVAERILREHLGLATLEWIPSADIEQGAADIERRLADPELNLAIFLVDSLGDERVRSLRRSVTRCEEVFVRGGQEVSRILGALPLREEGSAAKNGIGSVREAVSKAMEKHGDAFVSAFQDSTDVETSPYEDAQGVYEALEFLATTYRDDRSGRRACPDLDHALRSHCGFRYRAAASGRPTATATYRGRTFDIRENVGRGVNRDPRYAIRIGFHYLPDEDRVLLGYIGPVS